MDDLLRPLLFSLHLLLHIVEFLFFLHESVIATLLKPLFLLFPLQQHLFLKMFDYVSGRLSLFLQMGMSVSFRGVYHNLKWFLVLSLFSLIAHLFDVVKDGKARLSKLHFAALLLFLGVVSEVGPNFVLIEVNVSFEVLNSACQLLNGHWSSTSFVLL